MEKSPQNAGKWHSKSRSTDKWHSKSRSTGISPANGIQKVIVLHSKSRSSPFKKSWQGIRKVVISRAKPLLSLRFPGGSISLNYYSISSMNFQEESNKEMLRIRKKNNRGITGRKMMFLLVFLLFPRRESKKRIPVFNFIASNFEAANAHYDDFCTVGFTKNLFFS